MTGRRGASERELIATTDQVTPDLLRYGWASAAIEASAWLAMLADIPDE